MDTKTIWTSTTIWGAVVILLPTILKIFNIDLSAADASTAVGLFQEIVDKAFQLGGLAIVIYGRMRAKGPATILPK